MEKNEILFFRKLTELEMINSTLKVNMGFTPDKDGNISLIISMKSMVDESKTGSLPPIVITGTPEELDTKLIEVLQEPVKSVKEFTTNIEEFQKKLDEEKKALKEKASKPKSKTTTKTSSKDTSVKKEEVKEDKAAETKKKLEEIVEKIMSLVKDKKYGDIGMENQKMQVMINASKPNKKVVELIDGILKQSQQMRVKLDAIDMFPDYKPEIKLPWK